jgi:hypothetical protein
LQLTESGRKNYKAESIEDSSIGVNIVRQVSMREGDIGGSFKYCYFNIYDAGFAEVYEEITQKLNSS